MKEILALLLGLERQGAQAVAAVPAVPLPALAEPVHLAKEILVVVLLQGLQLEARLHHLVAEAAAVLELLVQAATKL
jgi:hypothetical protein